MLAKYITIFLFMILTGVVLAHNWLVPNFLVLVWVGLSLIMFGVLVCFVEFENLNSVIFSITATPATVLIGLSLGVMVWQNSLQINQFKNYFGQQINTEAVVIGWPNLTASGNQAILLQPDGFTQSLRASLRVPKNIHPNDRVWIRGQVKQPENFSEFNYVSYLQKNNVYAELDKAKVIIIKPHQGRVTGALTHIREWVIDRAKLQLSTSSAGLVLGMIIGYGDAVPKALGEAFKKTGLTHILVASGFNLSIIASSLGFLAWVIGRRGSDVASLGLIWMFVVLTGSSGSVVRAGIMTSLMLVARCFGRMSTSYFTLLLAVVVMVAINPMQLFYDIGFQLSVGATLGVLEANKLRLHLQKEGWLTELLWPTLGAIVLTAPLISLYFGTFSLIAPVANVLVLPAVPLVMLLGALSLLPIVGVVTIPITEFIVSIQEMITVFLANWQFSSVSVKSSLVAVIGYYLILFLIREAYYQYYFRGQTAQNQDLKILSNSGKITKISI